MKKFLSVWFTVFLIVSFALAQQPVNEERFTKSKTEGNVVFVSVLKDVNMVVSHPDKSTRTMRHDWILKFENGAVMRLRESKSFANWEKCMWWIGSTYVVYLSPVTKKSKKGKPVLWVELLAQQHKQNKEEK